MFIFDKIIIPIITAVVGKKQPQPKTSPSHTKTRRWLRLIASSLAMALLVCWFSLSKVEAADFSFTKVVDVNTQLLDGSGNFTSFSAPTLKNDNIAFVGRGQPGAVGVYTIGDDGSLHLVADTNTPIPGRTEDVFQNFDGLTVDKDATVAFEGVVISPTSGSSRVSGIYSNIGGTLNVVADLNTVSSLGSPGTLSAFSSPSIDNGTIAFVGFPADFRPGVVYTFTDGTLKSVNSGLGYPGIVAIDNGNLAVAGRITSRAYAITTVINGTVNTVNLSGSYFFDSPSISNGSVVHRTTSFTSGPTIVSVNTNLGGTVSQVAGANTFTTTSIPGGSGNFTGFGEASIDNGTIAFLGNGSNSQQGIYTTFGDSLTKVIATNDSLDGKTVSSLSYVRQGLSGNKIAFRAGFDDGSQGIYIANLNPTE